MYELGLSKALSSFKRINLLILIFDPVIIGSKLFIINNDRHAECHSSFENQIYLLCLLSFIVYDGVLLVYFNLYIFYYISNELYFLERVLYYFLEDIECDKAFLKDGLIKVHLHESSAQVCRSTSVHRSEVCAHNF